MNHNERSVTVLGLGNMGAAIADAVIAKGHRVTVWNRSPGKATDQVTAGARKDIGLYLMDYYNWQRPHSTNGGKAPAVAEENLNLLSGIS